MVTTTSRRYRRYRKFLVNLPVGELDQLAALARAHQRYLAEETRDVMRLHLLRRLRLLFADDDVGEELARDEGVTREEALERIDAELERLDAELYGRPRRDDLLAAEAAGLPEELLPAPSGP